MNETSNKLTVTLPSDLEIVLTRDFEAPRELVFEAFSKCEHLKHWWGSANTELAVCEVDFRVGGAWRHVVRMPDGSEHPFKGEYREIEPPERLARTLIYDVEYARDYPAVETLVLEERNGKTTLTATVVHKTKEGRDGHVHSGMEKGAAECYDRLEVFLRKLQLQD